MILREPEKRLRPIAEENLNPYGGRYWIEESWGKRFSTKEEDRIIEKLAKNRRKGI